MPEVVDTCGPEAFRWTMSRLRRSEESSLEHQPITTSVSRKHHPMHQKDPKGIKMGVAIKTGNALQVPSPSRVELGPRRQYRDTFLGIPGPPTLPKIFSGDQIKDLLHEETTSAIFSPPIPQASPRPGGATVLGG